MDGFLFGIFFDGREKIHARGSSFSHVEKERFGL